MATTSGKPTSRQLAYLKSLADRTGQTFTYPRPAARPAPRLTASNTPGPARAPSATSSAS